MPKYLGQEPVDLKNHPVYGKFTQVDWAMLYITKYGATDGAHHKAWVIDQVAQILKGVEMTAVLAKWDDGQEEYRFDLSTTLTPEYVEWRAPLEQEYGWDGGIPP